ncbi:MAG: polymerase sigma factor SigW [Planctomycetota bacterium]
MMCATLDMMSAPSPLEPVPATDEELFLQFRDSGDRGLFGQLVHRYERELYSYLRRYLGDADLASDAFQNTFLQIFLKRDQYDSSRRFRPWLYAIAMHQAIDVKRRQHRRHMVSLDQRCVGDEAELGKLVDLLVSSAPEPGARLDLREQQELVRKGVEELPEFLRSVIHMVYFQGLKYSEVAEALHLPVGTVKSRMHSAMLRLTEKLNPKQPDNAQ